MILRSGRVVGTAGTNQIRVLRRSTCTDPSAPATAIAGPPAKAPPKSTPPVPVSAPVSPSLALVTPSLLWSEPQPALVRYSRIPLWSEPAKYKLILTNQWRTSRLCWRSSGRVVGPAAVHPAPLTAAYNTTTVPPPGYLLHVPDLARRKPLASTCSPSTTNADLDLDPEPDPDPGSRPSPGYNPRSFFTPP